MNASTKLHQLESKISDLQKQHQRLLKERQTEISTLLSLVDLAYIDDKTLMGGLLFLKEKISTQDSLMEVWHAAGEKFLRRHKPRLSAGHQPHKGRKQGGNYPQSTNHAETYSQDSGKKGALPKSAHTPQATDQPPQEHPQPGEA